VAGFVGTSNIFASPEAQKLVGASSVVSIRPERLQLAKAASHEKDTVSLAGQVQEVIYLGAAVRVIVLCEQIPITVLHQFDDGPAPERGASVFISFKRTDLVSLGN
jgi:ABC-type Fe3+/spermidine/putrescine transport system ATPase subunit